MSSTTLHNTTLGAEHGQEQPAPATVRERRGLALREDNRVYLFDSPITALKPAQQFGTLIALLDGPANQMQHIAHVSLIDTRDLFYVVTGQEEVTLGQQDLWMQTYVQTRSAFAGLIDQLLLTSVGRVLPHRLRGGQEFLDVLLAAKEELKDLPVDIQHGTVLYGVGVITSHLLTNVIAAYDYACLTTWLMTISGGALFVRAVEDLRAVVKQLPSLQTLQQDSLHAPLLQDALPAQLPSDPSLLAVEQDLFIEQFKARSDEIQRDKDSRRALLLKLLEYAGVFLSIGLANVAGSGVIALAFPVIAFFLMAEWRRDNDKIGLNRRFTRNRIERIAYHKNLPWEIYRSIISTLVATLRKARKEEKQATFQQLVPLVELQARELLFLAPNAPIPADILTELEYALEAPANLLEFATRGVALFMQLLTLLVGIASVLIHVLQAPGSLQTWVVAGVAAIFVTLDGYVIFHTWKIIKHIR